MQPPHRAVAAAGGPGDAQADVPAVVAAQATPAPRHGEVLLRQREVGVDQRGEVVRGVAAAAAEQRALRALEPALGHAAHPAERAGGAGARGVVAAAGRHGLPHGAHPFLGGAARGPPPPAPPPPPGAPSGLPRPRPAGGSGSTNGGGTSPGFSSKLVRALGPRMCRAAASYARAASSAVSNVPSHRRAPRLGSRISAAQLVGFWFVGFGFRFRCVANEWSHRSARERGTA